MAIHGIVRTDKMTGTRDESKLFSVRYKEGGVNADIDNGNVVVLGSLETNNREVFIGSAPVANSPLKNIVLIATPEVMADERKKNLNEFYNLAGTLSRGYALETGDIFSVTKEALDGKTSPEIGDIVELQIGVKLNVVSALTSNSTEVGTILDIDNVDNDTYYVIKVS